MEFLKASSGWHAKADILGATGITDGQWNAAINDLIAGGRSSGRAKSAGRDIEQLGATSESGHTLLQIAVG